MKPKRIPKMAVPLGLIWWQAQKRHPLNEQAGRVIYRLRARRGWSLDDVARASGLAKSYLCELEHGQHSPTLEVQLRLECVFHLAEGGLLRLARYRLPRRT
jgi:transcriptional regulator with XRE-family HTH domain